MVHLAEPAYTGMQVDERRRQLLERPELRDLLLGSLAGALRAAGAGELLARG